ncbi:MAG: hypothetical protein JWO05_2430 [Gemmatimonadetes bacterium]|nr:hypothetical protein [Gemmatimonadota bacterium]
MRPSTARLLPLFLLATLAGCAAAAATQAPTADVIPGIEVALGDSLGALRGKRVGLITNPSGRDRRGTSSIDLLAHAPGVRLTAIFGPEHGLRGGAQAGETVATSVDSATGVTVYSLYGATKTPTSQMLEQVDVLVYDIQDAGARMYTYPWTMALAAEAAERAGKPFIVLDRPAPIRGDRVEGGVLDTAWRSFVGAYPVATRYGLTPGELLRYLVGAGLVKARVSVIPMQGWHRSTWYDETGLPWVNPSPNLRSLDATLLYTGTVMFESVNVSEGRGTDAPFQLVGAEWLHDAGAISAALNARRIPGVRFDSTMRTIEAGQKFAGKAIPMIRVTVTNRDDVEAVAVGAYMMREIYARHRADWVWRPDWIERLTGSRRMREAVEREGGVEALLPVLARESAEFARATRPYQLYPQ